MDDRKITDLTLGKRHTIEYVFSEIFSSKIQIHNILIV